MIHFDREITMLVSSMNVIGSVKVFLEEGR